MLPSGNSSGHPAEQRLMRFYVLRESRPPDPFISVGSIACDRAAADSESVTWPPGEAANFERSHETCLGRLELQLVALRRIADIQHDLLHGDFGKVRRSVGCRIEIAVQNWVAHSLRREQGVAYSIEREAHVVDEKEPDVRFRAKATDASVAMEIKVAESWSLKELEAASPISFADAI